ncbi:MAG: hypothetical protein ABEH78_07250 [Haloferacaceae archaeon]
MDEFLFAANYVVDHAWKGEWKTTSKAQLQEETYDDVRERTRLHANLVQNARNKAADAVQGTVARWQQGEYAGKPHFSQPTVVYDKRCATFHDGEAFACLKCGYENHADYNAAKNVGLRYLRRNQTGAGGGAPVGVRLNRGTLNASGEYESPAGSSGQSGSPRESPTLNEANGTAVSE